MLHAQQDPRSLALLPRFGKFLVAPVNASRWEDTNATAFSISISEL